jgi:hypothetical protein
VNQGYVSTSSAGHYVRLALIFLASVFGLILLSLTFGSSSASADDGGPDDSGLVPAAAGLAGGAVEHFAPVVSATVAIPLAGVPLSSPDSPVAPVIAAVTTVTEAAPATTISTPVSTAVDGTLVTLVGPTPVGVLLGTAPVGSILLPVAQAIDDTVTTVGDVIVPVLHVLQGLLPALAGESASAAAASVISSGGTATIWGSAHGWWPVASTPLGTGEPGIAGAAAGSSSLLAAALGFGFIVLLFSRRPGLVNSALPVSPVYDTDTSPD